MAERVANAILTLSTDTTGFNQSLGEVEKRASTLQDKFAGVGKSLQSFGGKMTGVGRSLSIGITAPIAAAVSGLVGLGLETSAAADRIAKGAREAGLSAGAYQELGFALQQVADVSAENVDRAFQKLTTRMGEAIAGEKTASEAMAKLGISQADLASGTIGTEQAFDRLIKALQNAKTPAEAVALAGDLLGERVGPKLAGALREGGDSVNKLREDFRKLGLGMSGETLAAAETFQDQLDVLKRQFVDLGRDIGAKLLPVIVNELVPFIQTQVIPMLRKLADGVVALMDWFGRLSPKMQQTVAVIGGLVVAAGPALIVIGQLVTGLGAVVTALGPVAAGLAALGAGPITVLVAAIVGLTAAWVLWGDDVKRITGQVVGWLTANFGPPVKAVFDVVSGAVVALRDLFVAAFELQLAIVQKVGQGIVTALKAVLSFFGVDWKDAVTAVGAVFEVAKDLALGAVKIMVEGIKAQFAFMLKVFDTARGGLDKVTGWFQSAKDVIVGNSIVPDMINAIGAQFQRLPTEMGGPTLTATQGVTGSFVGMAGNVGGIVGSLMDSLSGLIKKNLGGGGVVNSLVDTGMGVLGKTVQGMLGGKGFVTSITGAGMDALKGIVGNVMGKGGNIVDTVKGGWDAIKSFTSGGLKATSSIASAGMSGIAGIASKFMGPAGAIASGVGALFGEGTTGQKIGALVKTGVRVAAGVMTGGMSEMALAAFEGVKKIAGFFKDKFGNPSAEELGGREIVKNFEQNVHKLLTKQQIMEAGNEQWKKTAIFVRDAYKALGLSAKQGEVDVKALWGSSRDGAEASRVAVEAMIARLQGLKVNVPVSFDVGRLDLPKVAGIKVPVSRQALGGFGTVREPTLFLAGEAGPEDFAFSGANKSFGRGGGGNNDNRPIIIKVELDGREVARSTVKHMPGVLALHGLRE